MGRVDSECARMLAISVERKCIWNGFGRRGGLRATSPIKQKCLVLCPSDSGLRRCLPGIRPGLGNGSRDRRRYGLRIDDPVHCGSDCLGVEPENLVAIGDGDVDPAVAVILRESKAAGKDDLRKRDPALRIDHRDGRF